MQIIRITPQASYPALMFRTGLMILSLLAVIMLLRPAINPDRPIANPFDGHFAASVMSFVPNAGQVDPVVQYEARGLGGRLFFTPDEIVLRLPVSPHDFATLRLHFDGANQAAVITASEQLPGTVNYFIGNDPAHWQTDLATYTGITYHELYPGIDLYFDGLEGTLKGTYTVAPGSDPGLIRWRYAGAAGIRLNAATGELVVAVPGEAGGSSAPLLIERAPVAWQVIDGRQIPVQVAYQPASDGSVGFSLGSYRPDHALIIDPTLVYSTYIGGNAGDEAFDVAVDGSGNAYVTGWSASPNFPTTSPIQGSLRGARDVFIAKYSPSGTRLYATYLGGANIDMGFGIAVDNAGNAYVTGSTGAPGGSTPFPTTPGAFLTTTPGAIAAFVTKLNPTGNTLLYSTFYGGIAQDQGHAIAIDAAGHAYVFGETNSTNLPLKNPAQGTIGGKTDAFVAKFNPNGTDLVYATYIGGSEDERTTPTGLGGIAVDSSGSAYVAHTTYSPDLPVTADAFDKTLDGQFDGYVAKLNPAGNQFNYLTYLGGSSTDHAYDVAVDTAGRAHISGNTASNNFPTRNPLRQSTGNDAFVTILNPNGSDLVFSTYFGGAAGPSWGYGIALDSTGNIYVTGQTGSANFPTRFAVQPVYGGGFDAFVFKLAPGGGKLIYSTFLGGSGIDRAHGIAAKHVDGTGQAFVVGATQGGFPTQNAAQPAHGGGFDGFLTLVNDRVSDAFVPMTINR